MSKIAKPVASIESYHKGISMDSTGDEGFMTKIDFRITPKIKFCS